MHLSAIVLLFPLWGSLNTLSMTTSARVGHRKLHLASEENVIIGKYIVELQQNVTDIFEIAKELTAAYSTAKIHKILKKGLVKGFVVSSGPEEMIDAFENSPLVISVAQVRGELHRAMEPDAVQYEKIAQSTHTHQPSALLSLSLSIVLVDETGCKGLRQ